ncbi:hypothetical protein V1504DRAFT_447715 [Lipomyces starkeyi]
MHLTYRDDNKNIMEGGYKLCNFWSNLDIGSLKFWRLQAYRYFIGFLDRIGTFSTKGAAIRLCIPSGTKARVV